MTGRDLPLPSSKHRRDRLISERNKLPFHPIKEVDKPGKKGILKKGEERGGEGRGRREWEGRRMGERGGGGENGGERKGKRGWVGMNARGREGEKKIREEGKWRREQGVG